MRIITGSARGCRLKTPKGQATRPTSDRIKESLFNILGSLTAGYLSNRMSRKVLLSLIYAGRGIAIARMLAFPDLVFLDGGRCVEGVVRREAHLHLAA